MARLDPSWLFQETFVLQRRWLSEQNYADLVSLCQFLPGPASSQVGFALGFFRGGYWGACAAWLGFTLPSAALLILFAYGMIYGPALMSPGVIHGLKLVAVAVVIQAVWGMAKNLCPDRGRVTLMACACVAVLLFPSMWVQMVVLILAGLLGRIFIQSQISPTNDSFTVFTFSHGGHSID